MFKQSSLNLTLFFLLVACSSGGSTQSVEDVGDDTSGGNSGGVIIPEPVASFSISSNGGEAPIDVTFTSTSTGEVNSWLWNVDDDADIESTRAPNMMRSVLVRLVIWSNLVIVMCSTKWNILHYIHYFSTFNQKVSGLELCQDATKPVSALNR